MKPQYCPRCDADLKSASSCSCGWKSRDEHRTASAEPPRVQCEYEHEPCLLRAVMKIRRPDHPRLVNVCDQHAVAYSRRDAAAYCAARGLTQPAQQRAWLLAQCERIGQRGKPAERTAYRQPGEDWEEDWCERHPLQI